MKLRGSREALHYFTLVHFKEGLKRQKDEFVHLLLVLLIHDLITIIPWNSLINTFSPCVHLFLLLVLTVFSLGQLDPMEFPDISTECCSLLGSQ